MTRIASPQNPRLKALRRLHAKRERASLGRFIAEGEDLIAAARSAGATPVEGFCLSGSGLGEDGFHEVEEAALASASTLGSGARVLAVYEQRWGAPTGPLCVYLHGVGDPGNIGTVLRSARAFGASSVALGPGCADPHAPKSVRASMGAIFAVALARVADVAELPGQRIALVPGAGEPLSRSQRERCDAPITLLVGAERDGLPAQVLDRCERVAHIPIHSESINAAMAATVALYEMTRRGGRDNDTVPAS